MARFSKFKMLFALKLNLNGVNYIEEISKFGCFNNLQITFKVAQKVEYEVEHFERSQSNTRVGGFPRKKTLVGLWIDEWVGVKAILGIAFSNQK